MQRGAARHPSQPGHRHWQGVSRARAERFLQTPARGDDTLAAHHLIRAAKLDLQTTLVDWLYRWHVVQAQLKEAAGDLETAPALLDEANRVYIQTAVPDLRGRYPAIHGE